MTFKNQKYYYSQISSKLFKPIDIIHYNKLRNKKATLTKLKVKAQLTLILFSSHKVLASKEKS